jgi:hypothetical protein
MAQDANSNVDDALRKIRRKKVITVAEVASVFSCSVKTARRRLKQWKAITSYNENGGYYTLPNIPSFDVHGLWGYRGIRFSRHGNLKQTIIRLVENSHAGLDAAEMGDLLGIYVRSFLTSLRNHPNLRREKIQGRFVYFTAKEKDYFEQKKKRATMTRSTQLPSDVEAIAILVETIKNPHLSAEQLCSKLKHKHRISPQSVHNLFAYHGLTIKKTQKSPS